MLNVSFKSSLQRRLFQAALLAISTCVAQPAFAEGDAPRPISDFALSDEQIAQRCRASIATKFDMVEVKDENGDSVKVPRCVVRYEGMRTVANDYTNNELQVRDSLKNQSGECSNQANCVGAGVTIANVALDGYNKMVTVSEEARTTLDSVEDGTPIGMRVAAVAKEEPAPLVSAPAKADDAPIPAQASGKGPAPDLGNSVNVPQAQSGGKSGEKKAEL